MSIFISDANSLLNGNVATRLDLPATAGTKGASVSALVGMWIMTPPAGFTNNRNHVVMARAGGGTGGNDGFIRFAQAATQANFALRNGSVDLITAAGLPGLTPGLPLLVMMAINSTHTHLIACHPGGTPVVNTQAVTAPYTANLTATPLIGSLGAGTGTSANAWYGPIEEAFMLTRAGADLFTQTAGVPDTALIQAIANGTQDLDGLDTLLSATRKFRYRMLHNADLTDAWGVAAALTVVNEDKPTGKQHVNARTLRPAAMNPAPCKGSVAQCRFATVGSSAGATARIKTPGGTYSGISPSAIQARLRKEDGTALVDWTTVATPAAGVWPAGQLTGVPMTAGWLFMDLRAVDGGGAQIGAEVSAMTTGAGFNLFLGSGQSQFEITYTDGSLAIPSGIRVLAHKQFNPTAPAVYRMFLGSADDTGRGIGRGMRQAAIEINTLFPGVPIQFSTIWQSGTSVTEFGTGGAQVARWSLIAASMGVVQDFIWVPAGHSQAAGPGYQAEFEDMLAQGFAALGAPLIYCLMPVPRYSGAGTDEFAGGNADSVHWSRRGMRAWHEANRSNSYWGGSLSVVQTSETGSDPHPSITDRGSGRTGAILAWRAMEAIRAAASETIGLVSATKEAGGTAVRLRFGRVSNYPAP